MSKIIAADFTAPDAKTRNLMQRMGRFDLQDRLELICNGFDKIVFRTRFTLADQVLLHGLVAIGADVQVVDGFDKSDKNTTLKSLIAITQDAYAVKLSDAIPQDAGLLIDSQIRIGRKSSFAGKEARLGIVAVNPVADWSQEQLVQYILDHEVPVNPADMPGFAVKTA